MRLAILDVSENGRQPMTSQNGRWIVCLNGELYNHLSVRKRIDLRNAAVSWRSSGDTATLVEAISLWGVKTAAAMMDGMFALVAYDTWNDELYISRDRFGEKPMYYASTPDGIFFGSEVRSITLFPQVDSALQPDAINDFIEVGRIPGIKSIFAGVKKLPPGSVLKVGRNNSTGQISAPKIEKLDCSEWGLQCEVYPDLADSEYIRHIEALIEGSVKSRLLADVPIGVFLSGGVDSSLIAALAARNSTSPVKTFSIGLAGYSIDESTYAARVASFLGADHTVVDLDERELLNTVPSLFDAYGEPFADPSAIPLMLLSREARRSVKVALSGDGADELFGGYDRYYYAESIMRIQRVLGKTGSDLLAEVLRVASGTAELKWVLRLLGRGASVTNLSDRVELVSKLFRLSSAAEVYGAFASGANVLNFSSGGETMMLLTQKLANNPQNFIKAWAAFDQEAYLTDDILVKLDRATMWSSVEGRVPFLTGRLWNEVLGWPSKMRFGRKRKKAVLKRMLDRLVPLRIWDRRKQGFAIPVNEWTRKQLRGWSVEAVEKLPSLLGDGLVDVNRIRSAWRLHEAGVSNQGYFIWRIAILYYWLLSHKKAL